MCSSETRRSGARSSADAGQEPGLAGQEPGHGHGTEKPAARTRPTMTSDCCNCAFTGSSSWTRMSHQEILRRSSQPAGRGPLQGSCSSKSGPDFEMSACPRLQRAVTGVQEELSQVRTLHSGTFTRGGAAVEATIS